MPCLRSRSSIAQFACSHSWSQSNANRVWNHSDQCLLTVFNSTVKPVAYYLRAAFLRGCLEFASRHGQITWSSSLASWESETSARERRKPADFDLLFLCDRVLRALCARARHYENFWKPKRQFGMKKIVNLDFFVYLHFCRCKFDRHLQKGNFALLCIRKMNRKFSETQSDNFMHFSKCA